MHLEFGIRGLLGVWYERLEIRNQKFIRSSSEGQKDDDDHWPRSFMGIRLRGRMQKVAPLYIHTKSDSSRSAYQFEVRRCMKNVSEIVGVA